MSAKVFDVERSDYEKCKTKWNDIEIRMKDAAHDSLGNDYVRKTDIRITGDYLYNQSSKVSATILYDNNLPPQVKQQYNEINKEVQNETLIPASELKKMDEQQLHEKEQRLKQLEQKLVDFQKQWGININSKSSSQFAARMDISPTATLANEVASITPRVATHNLDQNCHVKINDLRSTLNSCINEINTQQTEHSRDRGIVAGAPLTKE